MHHFFKGQFFDFETVRILGTAVYGGSDVAEVLEAVGQIKDGDADSWNRAWKTQAERAEALADEAMQAGHLPVACRAYLRASNYTRASGYMLTGTGPNCPDPQQRRVCDRVASIFGKAAALFDCGFHQLQIPYKAAGITLPANLYLPPAGKRLAGKIPILVSSGGADALQEELFYMHPAVGPDLGYAVLTFEGPGQGVTLRRHDVKMRPDWEVVVGNVLDFLDELSLTRPELELDTSRIGVAGASLGGYFALRAAADPRIKACVALDPLYSMWDFATAHVSPAFVGAWDRGWLTDGLVDAVIGLGMRTSFQMKWEVSMGGTFFGLTSPARILTEMKRYSLALPDGKSYLERVKCPVLVTGASESLYIDATHHTMRVFNALTGVGEKDKEVWMAGTPGQGSLQAKMGALQLANQRTYQFLDRALGIERAQGVWRPPIV
ncbi:alpha/beta-hydrolase [Trichocladium antarcticum]|uniref:Alpha/beta-hydrolase n=1 Tax=Trichocladium antarcticum TaxID=1450529 RepID=A0AAN6UDR9_9PEZI|nr:alpha/beta-hydrolase [Trichocladium antarcticum]